MLNIPEQGSFYFIVHWSISPLTHSKITTYMYIPELSSAERVLPAQVLIWRWILIEPIYLHILISKYLAAYKNQVRKIYQQAYCMHKNSFDDNKKLLFILNMHIFSNSLDPWHTKIQKLIWRNTCPYICWILPNCTYKILFKKPPNYIQIFSCKK